MNNSPLFYKKSDTIHNKLCLYYYVIGPNKGTYCPSLSLKGINYCSFHQHDFQQQYTRAKNKCC